MKISFGSALLNLFLSQFDLNEIALIIVASFVFTVTFDSPFGHIRKILFEEKGKPEKTKVR